jgi:HSP20 family protein
MDVIQKPEELEVKASMPGVNPDDIDVIIEDNVLTIRAERKAETEVKDAAYLIRERASGSFFRALRLPESVDTSKVKSSYENGVLIITLPKAEEKKRKQIKVAVGEAARTIEAARKN